MMIYHVSWFMFHVIISVGSIYSTSGLQALGLHSEELFGYFLSMVLIISYFILQTCHFSPPHFKDLGIGGHFTAFGEPELTERSPVLGVCNPILQV